MTEKKVRRPGQIYLAGAAWIAGALLFPIYRLWGLALTALLSLGAYWLGGKLFPPQVVLVEEPEKPFATGEAELDNALTKARQDLNRLKELNRAIAHPGLSAQMDRMERAGAAILKEAAQDPAKGRMARRFVTYYLPGAVKILASYAKLDASGARGENAQELRQDVEQNAATIADAFEAQLDSLFSDEVLDITSDIDVLTGMMKGDGLA